MDKRVAILAGMCAFLMVTACAKAPTDEIAAAEKAVSDAQQSGGTIYAAAEYAKIEGTLAALKQEVSEQDGKFILFRSYGKVGELAATVKGGAEQVKIEATKKKEEMKVLALQTQKTAQEAVVSTLALVAKAPIGKDRAALEAIKNDAAALNAALNEVQVAMEKEDYLAAQAKANAIQQKSQAVSSEIKAALGKIGKGKSSVVKKK